MAKSVVLVAVVVALAMTTLQTTPTFSLPIARVVPQSLPEWEQIDSKLQALAIEKKMVRTQTLRDFLMGEVPNMVTYEVHTLHEGFVADVQVGDGFHFRSARPAATVADAKRSAAVAALWELQWQPAPKPSKRVAHERKRLRRHFQFLPPQDKIKEMMNDDTFQSFKKTRAKVNLLGLDEGSSQNDLLLYISGREDRFMKVVYKVNAMVNSMPKRLRPKVALHMDG